METIGKISPISKKDSNHIAYLSFFKGSILPMLHLRVSVLPMKMGYSKSEKLILIIITSFLISKKIYCTVQL